MKAIDRKHESLHAKTSVFPLIQIWQVFEVVAIYTTRLGKTMAMFDGNVSN